MKYETLTNDMIVKIQELLKKGMKQKDIQKKYYVSLTTISNINTGKIKVSEDRGKVCEASEVKPNKLVETICRRVNQCGIELKKDNKKNIGNGNSVMNSTLSEKQLELLNNTKFGDLNTADLFENNNLLNELEKLRLENKKLKEEIKILKADKSNR